MRNSIFRGTTTALAAVCLLGFAVPGFAAQNDDIWVSLEQPVQGEFTTGIGIIRGWAAAPSGIDRVELYIDEDPDSGSPNQVLGYGGSREGICAGIGEVSSYPDCSPEARPGFAAAFNFNLLPDGQHSFTVRAYANSGDHNDDSSTFTTRNLGEEFVEDSDRIVLPGFVIDGVRKLNPGDNSQAFDMEFVWSRASQRFVMSRFTEYEPLPFIVPTPPANLTATKDSGNVELTWVPPAGPGSERWFVIERKFNNAIVSGDFQVIGVVPRGADSFTDEDVRLTVLQLPGTYTYRVLTTLPWATVPSNEVTVSQNTFEFDPPDLPDLPDFDL